MQNYLEPVVLLASALGSVLVSAQQLGCDAVSCPTSENGQFSCTLANTTYSEIGITNFTTSLGAAPLTWTLAAGARRDLNDSTRVTLFRDLYLGAPANVNLKNQTTIQGCALSFDGIAGNLNFPGDSPETATTVGTCGDAMGSQCAADLQSQAEAKIVDLLTTSANSSDVCSDLADALRASPPPTCDMIRNGSWGIINAKVITGPLAPSPIQLGDCHPTTGQGYTLSQIDSSNIVLDISSSELTFWSNGITPVLSVFTNGDTLAKQGTSLSCLKIITAEESPSSVMHGGSANRLSTILMPVLVSAFWGSVYFLM